MKPPVPQVTPELLAWRRSTGADRFDESWEGVLHMVPVPNHDHQEVAGLLWEWLRRSWATRSMARVDFERNVARPGQWPRDYRAPDLVILMPDRLALDRNEYVDGGPDVVVEIRSPGDESDAKVPWYASIGCREIWIVDRDTRGLTLFVVRDGMAAPVAPGPDGWIRSGVTGIELTSTPEGRLHLRLPGQPGSETAIP